MGATIIRGIQQLAWVREGCQRLSVLQLAVQYTDDDGRNMII